VTGFATQRPFFISCQGKHSEDESSFACAQAETEPKKTRKRAIAAAAKQRVIQNPSPIHSIKCDAK
jgi:hypothetical protein